MTSGKAQENEFDLAILGAGFAGLAAAKLARDAGKRFCLIARDFGATRHFSGAFDLVDPRQDGMRAEDALQGDVSRHLEAFVAARPGHLFADLAGGLAASGRRLIDEMKSVLDFYAIPYRGDGLRPLAVFGSAGRMKPTAFAMTTHALRAEELGGAAVCAGFPFASDYPAAEIAKNLSSHFSSVTPAELTDWPVNRSSALAGLTLEFDREGTVPRFAAALKDRLGGARTLLIPPILGRTRYLENHAALEKALGVRVVELLSALPAVAGSRFCDAVERAVSDKKIVFLRGEAASPEISGGRVRSVLVSARGKRTESVIAREFILASGKFLGGGIAHRGSFSETLFGLPLSVNGEPLAPTTHVTQLISANGTAPQPFLSLGLAIDSQGRPAYRGVPVYENLKACGHVLAGFDFTRERCGFGASVASALAAS